MTQDLNRFMLFIQNRAFICVAAYPSPTLADGGLSPDTIATRLNVINSKASLSPLKLTNPLSCFPCEVLPTRPCLVTNDFFCIQSNFSRMFFFSPDLHGYKRDVDRALLIMVVS